MEEEQRHNRIYLLILGIFLIAVGIYSFSYSNDNCNCSDIKEVLKYESLELDISDSSTEIYDYYTLASNSYDISDYQNTIFYCEKSRKLSNQYSQELRKIKAEYPQELTKILQVRKDMIDKEIAHLFALYQACEYIESAARAYDSDNYEMGDVNIEGQNEQIEEHDRIVEEYYQLSAEYLKLREELLDE